MFGQKHADAIAKFHHRPDNDHSEGELEMVEAIATRGAVVAALVGSLALTNGCALMGGKDADRAMSMGELPAVVRGAAEKETSGCRIIEVEQEMEDGKLIYAITYDQAGTEMEIEYSPDGTLLSKGKE